MIVRIMHRPSRFRRLLPTLTKRFLSSPIDPSSSRQKLLSLFTGLFAGTIGSLVGMGGAFVAIPLLTGPVGLSQRLAGGTSMASVLATATGGIFAYAYSITPSTESTSSQIPIKVGNIHLPTAFGVSVASSITAVLGARFSRRLSEKQLKYALGVFMLCVAPSPLLRDFVQQQQKEERLKADIQNVWIEHFAQSLLIGSFSGFQAGLFGVGGGAVVVPALCLFTDLTYKEALGTSLAIMFPTAVFGSFQHFRQGTMVLNCAIPLAAGCLVGSYFGGACYPVLIGLVSAQTNEKPLKIGFSALMTVLGVRTLASAAKLIK